MKTHLILTIIILCTTSCAQTQNKEVNLKKENKMYSIENFLDEESKYITKENYVKEIMKRIKHYPKEPIYYLRINKQNCLIEIYVNDVRIFKDYELSNYITPIDIAGFILKSGEQAVTIRMYPVGDLINKSLGKEGPSIDTLLPNSSVAISVVQIDNKSEKGLNNEVLVSQNISPTTDGKFVASGLPYYEYSFTFHADIPYELEGWSKGQNLRKLDQKKLEQKALEFYKMVQQIYVNKDVLAFLKLSFKSDARISSSLYYQENEIQDHFNNTNQRFTFDYTAMPIDCYNMLFLANGKLLRLEHSNPDPFFRGELAASLDYIDEEGYESTLFPGITLYLPEGRSLDEGLMMWK